MLPGRVGERGGTSDVRALLLWPPLSPFVTVFEGGSGWGAGAAFAGGGGTSSMGESGGGGMLVPSVREKLTGASLGSSNRLPLAGILCSRLRFRLG